MRHILFLQMTSFLFMKVDMRKRSIFRLYEKILVDGLHPEAHSISESIRGCPFTLTASLETGLSNGLLPLGSYLQSSVPATRCLETSGRYEQELEENGVRVDTNTGRQVQAGIHTGRQVQASIHTGRLVYRHTGRYTDT